MARQNQDPTQKYYEYLKKKDVDVAPSYESFVNTLQNDTSRKKYYDYLKTKDVDLPPTYESFSNTLIPKKKESQSSEESTTTSQNQSFDPIENRKQFYDSKLQELIQSDEVINSRAQEILGDFQKRVQQGEFESEDQANKAYQQAIQNDEIIKSKQGEYVKYVDDEFTKDIKAIEKFKGIKQEASDKEYKGFSEEVLNTWNNIVENTKTLDDRAQLMLNRMAEPIENAVFGDEKNSLRLASNLTALEELDKSAQELKPTQSISDAISSGDPSRIASGVVTSVMQLGESMAKTVASGGLYPFIEAPTSLYYQTLTETAKQTGEKPISVILDDKDKLAIPAAAGILSGALEKIGIDKVTKRLLQKAPMGFWRKVTDMATTSGVEGTTESMQSVIEQVSEQVANGKEIDLAWKEVLDSGLTGAIGGGAVSGGSGAVKSIASKKSTKETTKVDGNELIKPEKVVEGEITQPTKETKTTETETKPETQTIEKLGETTDIETMEGGKSVNVEGTTLITTETDNVITLDSIKTEEGQTGKGKAKNALNKLTEQADKDGKTIELKVVPEEGTGTTTEGLTNLYKQAGFDKQGDKMIRKPKEVSISESKPIVKNEDGSYTYNDGKKDYSVKINEGGLEIVNQKTNESIPQYKIAQSGKKKGKRVYNDEYGKVRKEFEQNYEYNQGKTTQEVDLTQSKQSDQELKTLEATNKDQFVAEFSENPAEIATQWKESRESQSEGETVDYKDSVIAENIGNIREQDFNQFGDRKTTGQSISKSYFSKKGQESLPLDVKAQEMSEMSGVEITEQDVVDFMLRYPNGPETALKSKTEGQLALEQKFKDLTGLQLDNSRTRIVEAQRKAETLSPEAQSKIEEEVITPETLMTFRDELTEETYTKEDYEEYARTIQEETEPQGDRRNDKVSGKDGSNKDESPEKSSPRKKSKIRQELEDKTQTGKEKRSNTSQRIIEDTKTKPWLKDAFADKKGNYNETSKKLAEKESTNLIEKLKNELGKVSGLKEGLELLRNNDIPPIMRGPVADKLRFEFEVLDMRKEAEEVMVEKKVFGTESGQTLNSYTEDSSPEALVGLALRRGEENTKREFKKTELYDKLENLQRQYDQLAQQIKDGKISPKTKTSENLKRKGKEKREQGKNKLNDYFKNQKGKLNAGVPIDNELLGALKDIFEGYMLETAGNVAQAFERTKKFVSSEFSDKIDPKVLEDYREAVLEGNDQIIDDIVKDQQTELIKNIFQTIRRSKKAEGKVSKSRINEMLDLMSDPEANETVIMEIFAEQAGYDMLTKEDRRGIMEKTLEISKLQQEGKETLAAKELENLQNYMLDIKADKYTAAEIMYDVWYTFVLSGLTTVARSIKGSTITTLAFNTTRLVTTPIGGLVAVKHGLNALGKGAKIGYNTLKTGDTKIQIRDVGQTKPSYLKRLANTSFKELGWDKPYRATFKALVKSLTAPPTYLFRSIVAADQVLSHFSYEFNSTIIEYNNVLNDGYSRKKEFNKVLNEVAKRRADNKRAEINQKAEAEYDNIKKSNPKVAKQLGDIYKVKRANEMIAELRDHETVDKALRDAKVAALVSDPTGFLGNLYKRSQDFLEIKERNDIPMRILKSSVKLGLFPFMRVSFNWINMGMQYTPTGFYMASSLNKTVWTKQGMQPVSKLSKEEYMARAVIGTSVFLGIANSIFDWDEEEGIKGLKEDSWIEVTGDLTGDYTKEAQTGKKPYSFRLKNPFTGEYTGWFKYIDNPLGFALAPLGLMSDELTFDEFKDKQKPGYEKKQRHMGYLLGQGVFSVFRFSLDQSFNQSVNQFSSILNSSDSENLGKKIEKFISRPVGGLISPRIYTQTYQYWKAYKELPEKETDKWYETALKNVPFADAVIKDDKYDIFGYPISRNFEVPLIPDMVLQTIKENLDYREGLKEWKLIQKYPEVTVSRFTAPETYRSKKVDEEKKNDYVMKAGLEFRKLINNNYDRLDDMEPLELQEKLNQYRLRVMGKAKREVYND